MKVYRNESGTVYFGGLQTCGHISCPVCGPSIREKERVRVAALVQAHRDAGGFVYLFLLTVSHGPLDRLDAVLDALDAGRSAAIGGKGGSRWAKDRRDFGIVGTCWHREETWGLNGWHPHVHGLLFADRELDPDDLDALQSRLFGRHLDAVQRLGFDAGEEQNAVQPVHAPERVADYLTKQDGVADRIAAELTRGDVKRGKGMTPGALLARFVAAGDDDDLNRFRDYEQGCKGRRWRYLSPALCALYGVNPSEADEETGDDLDAHQTAAEEQDRADAQDTEGGQLVMQIPLPAWRTLTGRLGAVSHLRALVSRDDLDGARAFVASMHDESTRRAEDRPPAWGASRRRGAPVA